MNIKHVALALLLLPWHGQENPNRFKKIPVLPKNPNDLPIIVVNRIEHFWVTKKTLHQWRASHPDQKISRDLVSSWVDQEQASIAETFFFNTRLDQNFELESGQHLIYPTQYDPPKFLGEWNIPTSFDTKLLGHHVETIFNNDDQDRLHAKLTFGKVQLVGSDSHSSFIEETRSPDDLFMPKFKANRQRCAMTYAEGVHHLAGIFNLIEDEAKALLIFSEAKGVALDPISRNKRAGDSSKVATVSCDFIDLSIEIWTKYCRGKTPDQLRTETATWAASLLQSQKAIRLKTFSKEILWGEKSDLNPNGSLSSFASSYEPTDPSKRLSPSNPLTPINIVDGSKDIVLELTPEVTRSGHILVTYIWQMNSLRKEYVIHRVSDGEQWISDAWAPCFSFINQSGAIFLKPGENTLMGAFPVEGDQAALFTAKMRLFFLKAE
jgi:hypothetical protein